MVVNFNPVCGRPVLPPSKDPEIQKRREKERVPDAERKAKCGRKPLPPSDDPKIQARREKARANAEKKREGVKQVKASGMINQAIKMKIARKAVIDARPSPASSVKPSPAKTPFDKADIIKRFLKNKLILNKYTLQNRINRYNVVSKALEALKPDDCLDKKAEGFTIRNIVNLEKQIGTKSKYGAIYLTSLPNVLGTFPIASKVMRDTPENLFETDLMKQITNDIVLKGHSKHFTIMYNSTLCTKSRVGLTRRLVDYNELCNGDLKTLIENRDLLSNEEDLFNIFLQVFISVGTFHNSVGYYHRDAHYGNFLYQLNNETGYYHYKSGATDFYLKSCPYNMTIYDFGFSKKIKNSSDNIKNHKINKLIFEDYARIINAFLSKNLGWGKYKDLPSKSFDVKVLKINSHMSDLIYKALHSVGFIAENPESFKQTFFSDILEFFKTLTPAGMILDNRPPNVINTQPFII